LGAIKFFKAFLLVENQTLRNLIVSENLFEPIVDLFLRNGNKYNLIESALLDLFELIVKKNIKPVVKYIMEKFYDKLKDFTTQPLPIFLQLKELHDKNDYTPVTPDQSSVDTTPVLPDIRLRARQIYAEERAEEAWFNTENDDDEDDEDYTPPIYISPTTEFLERPKKRSIDDESDNLSPAFSLRSNNSPKKQKKAITFNNAKPQQSSTSSQAIAENGLQND